VSNIHQLHMRLLMGKAAKTSSRRSPAFTFWCQGPSVVMKRSLSRKNASALRRNFDLHNVTASTLHFLVCSV
jgi:hypothetical protein